MWPHRGLVSSFAQGFDVMETIAPTGVFREELRPATATTSQLLTTAGDWHDEVFSRPQAGDADEIYEATKKEIAKNVMGPLHGRSYYDSRFEPSSWRGVAKRQV